MSILECNHEFKFLNDAHWDPLSKLEHPAKYECTKCKNLFTASDVFQYASLKEYSGFYKWVSLSSLLISILALVFSFIGIYYDIFK